MRRLLVAIVMLLSASALGGCLLHARHYDASCRTQCERWSTTERCYHSCSVYRDGYCIVRRRVCRAARYCMRRVRSCYR